MDLELDYNRKLEIFKSSLRALNAAKAAVVEETKRLKDQGIAPDDGYEAALTLKDGAELEYLKAEAAKNDAYLKLVSESD